MVRAKGMYIPKTKITNPCKWKIKNCSHPCWWDFFINIVLDIVGKLLYYAVRCLRAWYNGSTSASQAEDEGSIPFARTKFLLVIK